MSIEEREIQGQAEGDRVLQAGSGDETERNSVLHQDTFGIREKVLSETEGEKRCRKAGGSRATEEADS